MAGLYSMLLIYLLSLKILMSIYLLHKKLINKKLTISVAESCTGGLLAHNLTKLAIHQNTLKWV